VILVVTVGVLAVILAFFKELVFLSFDEEMAWVNGVPVKALRYLFLVIMALVVIVTIYLVGIILVSALLVIPGAIAQNLARQLKTMVWVPPGGSGLTVGGLICPMPSTFLPGPPSSCYWPSHSGPAGCAPGCATVKARFHDPRLVSPEVVVLEAFPPGAAVLVILGKLNHRSEDS
jgi:hypothetical protein